MVKVKKKMSSLYFSFILIALHASIVVTYSYEEYILAPATRDVRPVAILDTNGNVSDADSLISSQDPTPLTFSGADSDGADVGGPYARQPRHDEQQFR